MAYSFPVPDYTKYFWVEAYYASLLYDLPNCSIGFWLNLLTVPEAENHAVIASGIPGWNAIECAIRFDWANQYSIVCGHTLGGGGGAGVQCIPGQVDAKYAFGTNMWRYFGFSRGGGIYRSYYGTRAKVIAAQTATYTTGPVIWSDVSQYALNIGGNLTYAQLGPWHMWGRMLSVDEHQSMARCTLPGNTSQLKIWCKMRDPIFDSGPYSVHFRATVPPPAYLVDQGCASFAQGSDYALSST